MSLGICEELTKHPDCRKVSEIIPDMIYFASFKKNAPVNTENITYCEVDAENSMNLAKISRFLKKANSQLSSPELSSKVIVFWASGSEKKRSNAAICVGTYAMVNLHMSVEDLTKILWGHSSILHLEHFLNAVQKALRLGLVDFQTFSEDDFEYLEKLRLSWVVPQKILEFSGPLDPKDENYVLPKRYLEYFRQAGVQTVIRLKHYRFDANPFVDEWLNHFDMNMTDTTPSSTTLRAFLEICEDSPGAVVVHGRQMMLGRSGCLMAVYLVKHCHLTAEEAVAWLNLCSPDCVRESQKKWLKDCEDTLWQSNLRSVSD